MVFSELTVIVKDVQIKVFFFFFILNLGPALVSILLAHSALIEKT